MFNTCFDTTKVYIGLGVPSKKEFISLQAKTASLPLQSPVS